MTQEQHPPVVSIVIPAHNAAKTIRQTIDSALAQTFTDFELIVIDDGSSDGTAEAVASVRDARVRLKFAAQGGSAVARNRGIALARGEMICFLDADDLWAPTKLERQLEALRRHPEAGVAYAWTDLVNERSEPLFRGGHVALSGRVYPKLLVYNFLECGSNPMVRRSALEAAGGFNEQLVNSEDWDLWLRLSQQTEFVAVPETLVYYRMSEEAKSANVERQARNCLALVRSVFRAAPESLRGLERKTVSRVYRYLAMRTVFARRTRRRMRLAYGFVYRSFRARPSVSVLPFLCILSVCAALTAAGANRALYRLSCRLPVMPL
jgi:glycosyltransferase involved in cell wall biosynthesis